MNRSIEKAAAATTAELERSLCGIVGVEAARVTMVGEEIVEIHIVAAPGSRPKHMMRDVRSYLAAALGIDVDHKRISIAVRKSCASGGGEDRGQPRGGKRRVEFRSVDVQIGRVQTAVTVRLAIERAPLEGDAQGVTAAGETERLLVCATLAALEPLLPPHVRLLAGDVVRLRLGRGEVIVAEVRVVEARQERRLIGACALDGERDPTVVCATLAALNRFLDQHARRGWTEFHVRADGQRRTTPEAPPGPDGRMGPHAYEGSEAYEKRTQAAADAGDVAPARQEGETR